MSTDRELDKILLKLATHWYGVDDVNPEHYSLSEAKSSILKVLTEATHEARIDELDALTSLLTPTEVKMDRPRYEVPDGAKYMEFPKAIGMEANQVKEDLNQIIQERIAELQRTKNKEEGASK